MGITELLGFFSLRFNRRRAHGFCICNAMYRLDGLPENLSFHIHSSYLHIFVSRGPSSDNQHFTKDTIGYAMASGGPLERWREPPTIPGFASRFDRTVHVARRRMRD